MTTTREEATVFLRVFGLLLTPGPRVHYHYVLPPATYILEMPPASAEPLLDEGEIHSPR